jgi:hypothetical protein
MFRFSTNYSLKQYSNFKGFSLPLDDITFSFDFLYAKQRFRSEHRVGEPVEACLYRRVATPRKRLEAGS